MKTQLDMDIPAIRAHYAVILCQLTEERGVSRAALLRAAEVPDDALRNPDSLLTLNQFMRVARQALALTGDGGLGLELGHRLKFTTHGSLAQAAISSDTIGEGLSVFIKYYRIRFAYMDMRFFLEGDDAVIQVDVQPDLLDLQHFNVEVLMGSLMDVAFLLFGTRLLEGGACRLAYPPPAHAQAYYDLFGDRVAFNAAANQLRFRKAYLSLELALSNPVARRMAEVECEAELRRLAALEGTASKVRAILLAVGDGRLPGLEAVAERMHVSARTLRRQLSNEQTSFQLILDTVRSERARKLLAETHRGIDDIAYQLGYSDPSNFGRAFRKWEGMSPTAFRERQQGAGDQ